MRTIIAAVAALLLSSVIADARHYHRYYHRYIHYASISPTHYQSRRVYQRRYRVYDRGTVVSHPHGCPGRAFCGCGVAVRIFGAPVRALWLASNWFKFPRAAPAPGMVAVRNHHVFAIERVVGPGTVLAYDPNSGRGLTRIHTVSLRGYTVVNPRGGRG